MNCAICLPTARAVSVSAKSGGHTRRAKNSIAPSVRLPVEMGKAKAPVSPHLSAAGPRSRPGSAAMSVIQLGSPLASTRRTRPWPPRARASRASRR